MKFLVFALIPLVFSFSWNNIASSALDFVPGVSTVKGLYEVYSGEDKITGENLTFVDRTLSLIGAILIGNLFKNAKHLQILVKSLKASARKMKETGFVQKSINYVTKFTKSKFRLTKIEENLAY